MADNTSLMLTPYLCIPVLIVALEEDGTLKRLGTGARLWASARYCNATTLSVGTVHVLARELS